MLPSDGDGGVQAALDELGGCLANATRALLEREHVVADTDMPRRLDFPAHPVNEETEELLIGAESHDAHDGGEVFVVFDVGTEVHRPKYSPIVDENDLVQPYAATTGQLIEKKGARPYAHERVARAVGGASSVALEIVQSGGVEALVDDATPPPSEDLGEEERGRETWRQSLWRHACEVRGAQLCGRRRVRVQSQGVGPHWRQALRRRHQLRGQ